MIARGFYSVAASVFAENGEDTLTPASFGCILLAEHATRFYLHSHINPNAELEEVGVLIADEWPGLKIALTTAASAKIFRTLVEREVATPDGTITVTLFIPEQAVQPGDTVLESGLPPHKFLGDDEPVPVP